MKRLNGAGTRLLQTIREFTVAQRTIAIIGVAVLVLGGTALVSQLTKPTYAPLFSGLSDSDASGVVAQLTKDKVPYELSSGTILVPADKVDSERLAAAAAGLPSSSTGGYTLLDDMGVTASEFQQNVTYKRAIEGELAKTIESINGVSAASVQLAIPQQTVFSDQKEDPTASVFVNVNTPLTSDQVSAVVHLVSAAYPGLTDANVSVVDQNGDTLSSVGGASSGSAAEEASDYEARTKASVQTLLDKVLGPGNAVVTVAADVSASSGETTSETYTTPSNAPVLSETNNDTQYSGDGSGAVSGVLGSGAGATGTDATDTSGTTGGSASGTAAGNSYKQSQGSKNNALNKTTTKQSIMPGTLNRQTIAVAMNTAAAASISTTALRGMVSAAAGVNTQRGDIVSVTQVPFSKAAATSASNALKAQAKQAGADQMTSIITTAIQVVGGLVFFVLIVGLLKKLFRRPEPQPMDAGSLNVVPLPVGGDPALGGMPSSAQLGAAGYGMAAQYGMPGGDLPTVALPQAGGAFSSLQADVDALAGTDPERTAEYLRALMSDRAPA